MGVYHTIYKTTNLLNNEYYIGYHKTENPDDFYLGSGKRIVRSIKKYGRENFMKEILFLFDNEIDAFNKERELVTEDLIKNPLCLNLKVGGEGGFDYIKRNYESMGNVRLKDMKNLDKAHEKHVYKLKTDSVYLERCKIHCSGLNKLIKNRIRLNKHKRSPLSEYVKNRLSEANKGEKNPNSGSRWMTNPETLEYIRISKYDISNRLNNGWVLGKIYKTKRGKTFSEFRWVTNSITGEILKIRVEELEHYLSNGWVRGRKYK